MQLHEVTCFTLGKGEVGGSIPLRGTSFFNLFKVCWFPSGISLFQIPLPENREKRGPWKQDIVLRGKQQKAESRLKTSHLERFEGGLPPGPF